jgi:short-subunit dehydrogenase
MNSLHHDNHFAGKSVLITGASGGLGRSLVQAFSANGATVIGATRGGRAVALARSSLTLDVTDPNSVTAAAAIAGDVDILINNAGVNGNSRMFEETAVTSAKREVEVNYLGTLNMLHAFVPRMRERRSGVIVNILSIAAHVNLPLAATYSASKAAAWSLTQAARAELMPCGIQVYAIFPSVLDTSMSAHLANGRKMQTVDAANEILQALRDGQDDAFLGTAKNIYAQLRQDPKSVESAMAERLPK